MQSQVIPDGHTFNFVCYPLHSSGDRPRNLVFDKLFIIRQMICTSQINRFHKLISLSNSKFGYL